MYFHEGYKNIERKVRKSFGKTKLMDREAWFFYDPHKMETLKEEKIFYIIKVDFLYSEPTVSH
jgi:hypothetical protein